MKHAGPRTIARLEELLEVLRQFPQLKEKKQGVFYRKSRAFLHFHEDGEDIHADVRLGGDDFERFRCTTRREQLSLAKRIREQLDGDQ
ncbi:MAG: hypothetical protein KDI19_11865 [Pseudomonadales bacterium]|nr:hypothetical protein [Pseudomonadales bacterium]